MNDDTITLMNQYQPKAHQALNSALGGRTYGGFDTTNYRYAPTHYWWPTYPSYPTTTTIVINDTRTAHRACSCPNCTGECCQCADCKVKRLEKRVAELEANKE